MEQDKMICITPLFKPPDKRKLNTYSTYIQEFRMNVIDYEQSHVKEIVTEPSDIFVALGNFNITKEDRRPDNSVKKSKPTSRVEDLNNDASKSVPESMTPSLFPRRKSIDGANIIIPETPFNSNQSFHENNRVIISREKNKQRFTPQKKQQPNNYRGYQDFEGEDSKIDEQGNANKISKNLLADDAYFETIIPSLKLKEMTDKKADSSQELLQRKENKGTNPYESKNDRLSCSKDQTNKAPNNNLPKNRSRFAGIFNSNGNLDYDADLELMTVSQNTETRSINQIHAPKFLSQNIHHLPKRQNEKQSYDIPYFRKPLNRDFGSNTLNNCTNLRDVRNEASSKCDNGIYQRKSLSSTGFSYTEYPDFQGPVPSGVGDLLKIRPKKFKTSTAQVREQNRNHDVPTKEQGPLSSAYLHSNLEEYGNNKNDRDAFSNLHKNSEGHPCDNFSTGIGETINQKSYLNENGWQNSLGEDLSTGNFNQLHENIKFQEVGNHLKGICKKRELPIELKTGRLSSAVFPKPDEADYSMANNGAADTDQVKLQNEAKKTKNLLIENSIEKVPTDLQIKMAPEKNCEKDFKSLFGDQTHKDRKNKVQIKNKRLVHDSKYVDNLFNNSIKKQESKIIIQSDIRLLPEEDYLTNYNRYPGKEICDVSNIVTLSNSQCQNKSQSKILLQQKLTANVDENIDEAVSVDNDMSSQYREDWCVSQDFFQDLFGEDAGQKIPQDLSHMIPDEKLATAKKNCTSPEDSYHQDSNKTTKQSKTRKRRATNKDTIKPTMKKRLLRKQEQIKNKKITDFFKSKQKASRGENMKHNSIDQSKINQKGSKTNNKKNCRKSVEVKKKKKFYTPAISQFEEIAPPADVIQLSDSGAIELLEKCFNQLPEEICFDLIFDQGNCQLTKSSTSKKEVIPIGLLFFIYWKIGEQPLYYYLNVFTGWSDLHNARKLIKHLFSKDLQCKKICYNAKEIFIYLMTSLDIEEHEVELEWHIWDVMVGCWLLNPDKPSASFGGVLSILNVKNNKKVTSSDSIAEGCYMLQLLSRCSANMCTLLKIRQLWKVFVDIEMKVVTCLAAMEKRGIMIREDELFSINSILQQRMDTIKKAAYDAAGMDFKLNSTVELRKILYEFLKLDADMDVAKTEVLGDKSTSRDMLMVLKDKHPLPGLVLEFRHIQKALSTFVLAISRFAVSSVVRAKWEQTGASTGRLSCNNPNLQAIPKQDFPLVLFPSTICADVPHLNLRSPFVARGGFTFMSVDFCHIEFRVFANLTRDENLLKLFQETEDVFMSMSTLIGGVTSSPTISRETTKKFVYATIYGAGPEKLSEILDCSLVDASNIWKRFSDRFSSFKNFGQSVIERARRQGYLCSLSGRRRLFPDIKSSSSKLRKQAERRAINFLIQGSAADICKSVMIKVEHFMRQKYKTTFYLILQIHDELMWEVQDQYIEMVADDFKKLLSPANKLCSFKNELNVPLPVKISIGKTWGTMKSL